MKATPKSRLLTTMKITIDEYKILHEGPKIPHKIWIHRDLKFDKQMLKKKEWEIQIFLFSFSVRHIVKSKNKKQNNPLFLSPQVFQPVEHEQSNIYFQ